VYVGLSETLIPAAAGNTRLPLTRPVTPRV